MNEWPGSDAATRLRQWSGIEDLADRVSRAPWLTGLLLLGSFARGAADSLSDVDFIVVGECGHFDEAWAQRHDLHPDGVTCWDYPRPGDREVAAHRWLTDDLVLFDGLISTTEGARIADPFVVLVGDKGLGTEFERRHTAVVGGAEAELHKVERLYGQLKLEARAARVAWPHAPGNVDRERRAVERGSSRVRVGERLPESVLWDFLRGALQTKSLGIVADLEVANALAAGPRSAEGLAAEVGADPDVLGRLLRALASDGVFAEDERGLFSNTETSELLARAGWGEFAHLFGGVFYEAGADLDRAVRTGASTFPDRFGTDFWGWLAAHPEERAIFDGAMAGEKARKVDRLAALEWRNGETIVDVGGGNGALLAGLLRHRPGLHGIVFDLPETHRDESELGDDVEFVEGSFFERVPAGDVYVLSGILHDWGDEPAAAILATIAASAPPAARVLILDAVVPRGNEPNSSKWLDLLMHVLAGGRERDEAQWRQLLAEAGLEPVGIEDGLVEARCP